jgi:RpiR family transcriptional regulator, carbohydrate utilization regulator
VAVVTEGGIAVHDDTLRALSQVREEGGCLIRIRSHYPSLTAAEQRVADFILTHPEEVLRTPISNLASRCDVSDATVFRFSQSLGYAGFPQLKAALAVDLLTPGAADAATIVPGDTVSDIVRKIMTLANQGIFDTFAVLREETLQKAVAALCAARAVEVYGLGGTSGPLAEIVAYRFLNLGLRASGIRSHDLLIKRASMMEPGDVVMGISHSGVAVPVVEALRLAREQGATTVCLTNYARSPITAVSDIVLQTAARESPRLSEAVTARIMQLAVLDALYSGVALATYSTAIGKEGET